MCLMTCRAPDDGTRGCYSCDSHMHVTCSSHGTRTQNGCLWDWNQWSESDCRLKTEGGGAERSGWRPVLQLRPLTGGWTLTWKTSRMKVKEAALPARLITDDTLRREVTEFVGIWKTGCIRWLLWKTGLSPRFFREKTDKLNVYWLIRYWYLNSTRSQWRDNISVTCTHQNYTYKYTNWTT